MGNIFSDSSKQHGDYGDTGSFTTHRERRKEKMSVKRMDTEEEKDNPSLGIKVKVMNVKDHEPVS